MAGRLWSYSPVGAERRLRPNASCTLVLRLLSSPKPFGPYAPAPLARTPLWEDAISRQCAQVRSGRM